MSDGPSDAHLEMTAGGWHIAGPVKPVTCPVRPRFDGDIVGCGSAHLSGPDTEGYYDCLDCGIFFTVDDHARGVPDNGVTVSV